MVSVEERATQILVQAPHLEWGELCSTVLPPVREVGQAAHIVQQVDPRQPGGHQTYRKELPPGAGLEEERRMY